MMSRLNYQQVTKFINAPVPREIEDDILEAFAKNSLESDMTVNNLDSYFNDLQLPKILCSKIRKEDLCLEGTNVIDFERIISYTYHILIFMDNEATIDEMWKLLVRQCARDVEFPNVLLKNHVLSIKDIQKVANTVGMEKGFGIIEMMSMATSGSRVYMTYLDFAFVLGKLGYLRF